MSASPAGERGLSTPEFAALVAFCMSLVAMSIDAMLPALGRIAEDLGARQPNDRQLVLTIFFGGLTAGQLVYGPLSDALGRKRAMVVGLTVLAAGSVVCLVASSFAMILAGRFLSGVGAAGPRIVSLAVVRDRYEGRAMARIMSIVMAIFILVPIIAPSVGQAVLLSGSWRAIFGLLLVMTAATFAWFGLRCPETLPKERRRPLSLGPVLRAFGEVFRTPQTLGYTLAAGFVFGAVIAYLAMAQQIFGEQYGLGPLFPLCFAALAAAIGLASIVNARLVMRFGMLALSDWALRISVACSLLFLCVTLVCHGHPPLAAFMGYMLVVFFCNGLLFGNFNALAMDPMGHMAGSAAAAIGSLTSLISVSVGTPIGRLYDATVTPLVAGFCGLTLAALLVTLVVRRLGGAPSASA